jgi:type I restriction enzyme S subunit
LIDSPPQWPRVRARYLYRIIDERVGSDRLPLLAVSIHHGVVPRETLTEDEPRADDLGKYKRCLPGDVVLNRMRAFQGAIGIAPEAGIVSPDYVVLRMLQSTDARFVHHLFRSSWFVAEMTARLRGIGGSDQGNVRTPRINVEDFGEISLPLPPLDEQREIADFLDAETARIDALIEKKQRLIAVVDERARTIADDVLWSNVGQEIPLMHLVQPQRPVMYGIVLPGPDVGEEGVPIVKGGDVEARLILKKLARTTPEIERPYARARLRRGDVVFAIRGGVGAAAIVPSELDGANITQDVARVAPALGISSEWLLHVLRSRTFQHRARELVRGATITGLNIRDLERVRIPWADSDRQEADLAALQSAVAVSTGLSRRLIRQIDLFRERRQALITAAVTGVLDVARCRRQPEDPATEIRASTA